ncbi:MAG: hypothetical protein SAJ12_03780 [Jaaginema sp. PMC 1079.18]|nr:hypothetical protein [Jaaginema sp. PMC 1080.18]MEC4850109.1 hypothetical protein [Jaaginema sp. PMC 1079.18]MEC4864803.1 hypothetical protein [Jaaginema sp. PMC 1078.18]
MDKELSRILLVLEDISAGINRIEAQLEQKRQVPDRQELRRLVSVEVRRLGWTKEQGSQVLKGLYSKSTTQALTDTELANFLRYLISLTP